MRPNITTTLCSLVATTFVSSPAYAQGDFELFRQIGDFPGSPRFARIHDFDGDGRVDFLVADPTDSTASPDAGSVQVVSGDDGSTLFRTDGSPGDQLGGTIQLIPDLTGDAVDEFAVSALGANSGEGAVFVYSGIDGSLLARIDNPNHFRRFASKLCSPGDIDGDGYADLGIRHTPTSWGEVLVYSIAKDRGIAKVIADYLLPLGDVNGDGVAEVIAVIESWGIYNIVTGDTGVTLWSHNWFPSSASRINDQNGNGTPDICFLVEKNLDYVFEILDGADGSTILANANPEWLEQCWGPLTPYPDLDGDSVGEMIGQSYGGNAIRLYSTRTGERIVSTEEFEGFVGSYPDDNGDGVTDFAVKTSDTSLGIASVLPGLRLHPETVSVSQGTSCTLAIDFAAFRSGTRYLVLASESTHGQATWINDFRIPLGWSPFLTYTLAGEKVPGTSEFWGELESNGDAVATLSPGKRSHALIGREIWMSVLLYEEWGQVPIGLRTSMPRRIQFVH